MSRITDILDTMDYGPSPESPKPALAWLDDGPRCVRLQARLTDLHLSLRQDTARKAGDAIAKILGQA